MSRSGSKHERGDRLLRLGSARPDDAAPSAGFEERLRTRMAEEERAAASHPDPRRSRAWNGGFQALVKPALAMAGAAALLAAGLFVGAASSEPDDLASLVEVDPVFSSIPWDAATSWSQTP